MMNSRESLFSVASMSIDRLKYLRVGYGGCGGRLPVEQIDYGEHAVTVVLETRMKKA